MNRFASCIIPDAELEAYLADKLTVKPDYSSSVGPTEVRSDYIAVKARMDEMRRANNDETKRNYGLRGKK